MARQVIVAGSTGLIGTEVLRQLAGRTDVAVSALVRKAGSLQNSAFGPPTGSVKERVFDFTMPRSYDSIGGPSLPCDVLLCCIGSTMRQAGSQAAFQKVERDIPLALIARLVALGPNAIFGFVSSAGAGKPLGFYLQTKAEVEQGIVASGVRHVIVRPSLLLGDRREFRAGERLATVALPPVAWLVSALTLHRVPAIGRLVPIRAERVARTLIHYCVDKPPMTSRVIEGYAFPP